jgi:hypothetical protein
MIQEPVKDHLLYTNETRIQNQPNLILKPSSLYEVSCKKVSETCPLHINAKNKFTQQKCILQPGHGDSNL